MSGWFARKKSPRPSSSPGPQQLSSLVSSSSLDRPRLGSSGNEMKLEGGGQGLYNPLAWDSMPSVLREKFPHWKESSPAVVSQSKPVEEPSFQFLASSVKQPAFTIPYVVMENDTIHSIAVKFETTPTDIARINKKPVTLPLFPGEVIYVPDQDELAHRCESPEEEVGSPVESGDEGQDQQEVEQGEELPQVFMEEISDTHIAILSKYISEDQGCVYGTLMVNRAALMFAPRALDPLIREHGTTGFEAVIPLEDISYAAFSRDISSPRRLSAALAHTSLTHTDEVHTKQPHAESADNSVTKEANEVEHTDQQPNTSNSDNQPQGKEQDQDNVVENHSKETNNNEGSSPSFDSDGSTLPADNKKEVPAPKPCAETLTADDQKDTTLAKEELIHSADDHNEESHTNEGGSPSINSVEGTSPINKWEIPSADNEGDTLIMDTEGETSLGDSEVSTPVADRSCSQMNVGDEATTVQLNSVKSVPVVNITPSFEATQVDDGDCHNHDVAVMKESGSSTDNLLAQLALAGSDEHQPERSHTDSAESSDSMDSKLSDQAIFLHLYVSPKSGSVFTYTPINKSVGIDIPNEQKQRGESSIQHVKNHFCFAVAEKRLDDVVHFILEHHPVRELGSPPPEDFCWSAGVYEFISRGSSLKSENLLFQDDHYATSSSWEVYSLKDVPRSKIDRMDVEANLPLPTLLESSDLLQDDHLKRLSLHLPSQAVDREWYLIYSTFKHGISLRTMYRNMTIFDNEDSPVILVIRDDCGKIFGAAVTCPLRISEKFYGTGESYLFSFDSPIELKIFSWTGLNNYIVKGNSDSFSIGSGDGHPGLWVDEYFYHGSSYNCSTFGNDCLASSEDFVCSGVEAWGFPYK